MKLGISIRAMGPSASASVMERCAREAEAAGLDDLWLPDHVAIPPEDAEGSDGRYLDVLASLAWLAGRTERIGLGTGVLVLPYRPPLPTAKWLATIQELSGGRLRLGVGIGWMDAEFRALGLDRHRRGSDSDRVLAFLHHCFDATEDVAEANGQRFYFRPRPPRPPIFVGGSGSHALERAARYGDGWMPMQSDPAKLAPAVRELRERFDAHGRGEPEVVTFGGVSSDPGEGAEQLARHAEAGVTRLVSGARYGTDPSPLLACIEALAAAREASR